MIAVQDSAKRLLTAIINVGGVKVVDAIFNGKQDFLFSLVNVNPAA